MKRNHFLLLSCCGLLLIGAKTVDAASAAQDFQKAFSDYQKGQNSAAILDLRAAIATDPKFEPSHGLLGYLLLKQGQTKAAIAELKAAAQLAPKDTSALNNLGDAYIKMGDLPDAIRQYQEVLALQPNDRMARLNLALAYLQSGRAGQAVPLLQACATDDPTAETCQDLGLALQKTGQPSLAAAAFWQAAQLSPQNAALWLNAGMLYRESNPKRAQAALANALALGVADPVPAQEALGALEAQQGQSAQAAQQFQDVTQKDPQDFAAFYNLGLLRQRLGQNAAAVSAYRKALALRPGNPQAALALGLLLAQNNNPDAIPLLNQVITKNPADDNARLALAGILMHRHEFAQAAAEYEALARHQPNNAPLQISCGLAYEGMGDLATAESAFLSALTIDPKNAQAENDLGVVYEKQGKESQAIAAYKQAEILDPTLPQPRKNLARFADR